MNISNFEVKPGQPYIIAEVGSNWTSFEDCLTSIRMASAAGANAVKFQYFTHKALYGVPLTKSLGYDEKYELKLEWLPKLRNEADRHRVDLMCTIFDADAARTIDPYVQVHKVASSDVGYEQLLLELNRLSKTVLVSTGAATETEITMALSMLSNVPSVLLYCVANYPAKNVDLTVIDKLGRFGKPVGYSDHTTDFTYIPYAAAKFHNAVVIEKHFTAIAEMTPDSGHSLNPAQFTAMVNRIRGKMQGHIGPIEEERDMILRGKRRLVATEPIAKGDLFRKGKNFGAYRSLLLDTKGLGPWNASLLHNKIATRDIEPGEPIGVTDFG